MSPTGAAVYVLLVISSLHHLVLVRPPGMQAIRVFRK